MAARKRMTRRMVEAASATRDGTVLRHSVGGTVRRVLDLRIPGEHWVRRHAAGKALRAQFPRERHAEWSPPKNRPDPIEVLERSNQGRQAEFVPIRMGRMASSPFGFLRGAGAVMAWDLSQTPRTGITAIIDGDAHLGNFGFYGTPQRDVVMDLNDFDEATVGPWEWDLKRLVASVNVAGRENGLNRAERRSAVKRCVSGYRQNVARIEKMGVLDVWYLHAYPGRKSPLYHMDPKTEAVFLKAVTKASQQTSATLLQKVAERAVSGGWRLKEAPPILIRVDPATREKVTDALNDYANALSRERRLMISRYHVVDVAHRIVGVGSVGTRAYLVLLFGNDDNDPLFLQVKEATEPVHAPYLPALPDEFRHNGWRVVAGQIALQSTSDTLLGWTTIDDRSFYVRQMKNMKGGIPIEWITGETFEFYAWACGVLLARAHSRTGDAAAIAGYCGNSDVLDEALATFAERYGNQTVKDHAALVRAVESGRVKAIAGV